MRDDSFKDFVLDQLSGLDVFVRPMFGSFGLYLGDKFFGIVSSGRLYFKTDDATRGKYIEREMGPFTPSAEQILKNYYEVPLDVVEDVRELKDWAQESANL